MSYWISPLHPVGFCICTSASSRAVWISAFSVSTVFLAFSSSWMLFPVSPSCSVRSEISSATRHLKPLTQSQHLPMYYWFVFQDKTFFLASLNKLWFGSILRPSWLTLEILVLPLKSLQLVKSLLIGVLHLEQLSAERASLFLGTLQLCLTLLIFLLPFCQDLWKTVCVLGSFHI